MKEIKIGLIGLGFMGTIHFGIYKNLPGAKVVAIADVDEVKLTGDISKVVGNIGNGDNSIPLDLTGIKTYQNGFDLIKDQEIDIVDICVPTPFHTEYLLKALEAGKNVFCEKPLCRTLDELKKIKTAVAESDKFFNVGMCVRAWPEYRHAWELVQNGTYGKVKSALFRRLSPSVDGNSWNNWFMQEKMSGGAILDLHLHDTDFVNYMFGAPTSVTSVGAKALVSDNGIDHVVTSYEYDNGVFVTAEGGWAAAKNVPFEMSFQIICEKATIKLDANGYNIYCNDGTVITPELNVGDLPTGWHQELNYFVNCVRDGVTPDKYQTPESIFNAVATVMAEIESVESGKKVEVKYV